MCKKIVSEVSLYTDLSGYEHLIEKEVNNKEITIKECEEMIKNKYCEFGSLKKSGHSYHTNNRILNDYPNRFISLFKSKHYLKENCVLIETKVFSHYNLENPVNALENINCKYSKGKCQIKPNEVMIWEVNQKQNCKFISIGTFDGYFNNNFWINHDNQIALNLLDKDVYSCDNDLKLTSEGYALKSVRRDKREVETFQEAGELQYLENNFEKYLNLTIKIFCQMHNDNNEILEILLKENPKRFIQKALNHSAIDVKLINDSIIG